MEIKYSCSLCYSSCCDYKLIQNERGESTEIYEVAVKYFDPMILTEDEDGTADEPSTRVLCDGCWSHIHDFHEFQQTVLKSRIQLHGTKDQKIYYSYPAQEITVASEECKNFECGDKEHAEHSSDADNNVPLKLLLRRKTTSAANRKTKKRIMQTLKPKRNRTLLKNKICESKESKDRAQFNSNNDNNIKMENKPVISEEEQVSVAINVAIEHKPDIKQFSSDKKARHKLDEEPLPTSEQETNYENIHEKLEHNHDKSLSQQKTVTTRSKRHLQNFAATVQTKNNYLPKSLKEKCIESDLFLAKWKPSLDCDLCAVTVANFDEMRDHFRKAHNTRSYIKCCERKFYRRSVLIDHIRLHVNPETYKCEICGKPSTTRYNLKKHKLIMHCETKQFECEVCHKEFNQKTNLDRHLLTHVEGDKKFFCKDCGRGYVLEVQLNNHIKSVHEDDSVCDQCGKTIHGAGAIKKHLMEHTGTKRKFPCDICGVEIVSKIGLKRHKAAFHHDGSTAYVCGICGKVASSENALMSHKNYVHENNRKYKCTYCDKAFIRPKGLREHIATHTGVDLYQCPHCPQTFKVSANMHHHRKRAHPIEWEEARRNRVNLPKVNIEEVKNQIVL